MSINAFALSVGLKRAENLYQIKRGKNDISRDLAYKIHTRYPDVSVSWLLTGEGEMLTPSGPDSRAETRKKIPFFDSGLESLALTDKGVQGEPSYFIDVPTLSGSDFAAVCVGDSMAPDLPAGAIVTLKEIEQQLFLSGEIYLVVTDSYSTIKKVMATENDPSLYRLIPKNTSEYSETTIPRDQVRRMFLIKGVISTRVL